MKSCTMVWKKILAKNPLVSVIVPTRNSEETIEECLESIRSQTYPNIEIIVVDNYSSDATVTIATKFDSSIYLKEPERSAQKNFGALNSHGKYLLFVDSDMVAPKNLVKHCVTISENEDIDAVLIPYLSIGEGYWTKCRCLESQFHQTKDFSMPRFFRLESFMATGGFDDALHAGEDIDLYLRLIDLGFKVTISKFRLIHLDKKLSITDWLRKDIWAMPYVSSYLKKRKKYRTKFSGARHHRSFLHKEYFFGSNPKYFPGLLFLKAIDYITVLLSWILE